MATGYEDLIPQRKTTASTGYEDLIPKPSAAVSAPATPAQRRPAFLEGTEDIPRMLPKAKSAPPVQREEEPKIGFTEVVKNDNLFNIAQNYLKASGQPTQEKDESREDVINRFMSEQRFARLNTTFGAVPELSRIVNATPEVKKSIAEGRDLYDKMASAYDEGGQGGVRPVLDVAKAIGADIPLYAGTGAVGALGGRGAVTALTKAATPLALRRGATAGVGVMEGAVGAAQEATEQRIKQEEAKVFGEEPEPLDATRIAAVGLFSAVAGAGVPMIAGKISPAKVNQQGQALAKAITNERQKVTPTNPNAPLTPVEQALVDPLRDNMDQVHDQYMKLYGRDLLNIIDPANALTDAKVRTDMSKAAVRVAMKVVELDDAFKMKPNEQISSALNKVFARLGQIDDVVLEKAITEAGVTKEMFAAMNKATVSDAARVMQQYSAAARALKAMTQADPDFDKKIKNLYTYENDQVSALGKLNLAQQRLAREWKALITSGVDTTARNALSTAIVVPLKTGIQLMEGTAYSIGNALSKASAGKRVETLKRSMSDTVHDAFDVYFYMKNSGVAREAVDAILQGNPSLKDNINNALQETGDRQVSAIAKWANTINVAMDSFVRRAVFTSTVERELRRQGKNLYLDFLDKNVDIPAPIIKQAMKEALQTTYAYVPKAEDKSVVSEFERAAGTAASEVIRRIDRTPLINFAIPFPRYMSNAMAFLYRYSPAGMVGARQEWKAASELYKEAAETGSEATLKKAEKIRRSSVEKGIQASIGLATLAAAYDYRKENPDVPWYEVKNNDGESIDIRGLGNPANYFALADVVMRIEQGTYTSKNLKDAFESVVGLKIKAGGGDTYFDGWIKAFESEKFARELFLEHGKFVGDIAGGFTQPFVAKQLVDLINLIRDEGRVVRDLNIIDEDTGFGAAASSAARQVTGAIPFLSEGTSETIGRAAANVGAATEAATNRVMGKLPILKEQLPEAVIRLTPEELSREGEFFNRLIGFRQTIQRSPLESEIVRLNLNPYELYGSGSGDRQYDRAYIRNANELITNIVPNLMRSNNYRMLPDDEKLLRLSSAIREQASIARVKTKEEFKAADLERFYKMRFNSLPARIRRSINLRYAEDNDGVKLDEAKDWFSLDKYEAELKARTGGLSEQTNRAFGR
jgi:hypothetical protein